MPGLARHQQPDHRIDRFTGRLRARAGQELVHPAGDRLHRRRCTVDLPDLAVHAPAWAARRLYARPARRPDRRRHLHRRRVAEHVLAVLPGHADRGRLQRLRRVLSVRRRRFRRAGRAQQKHLPGAGRRPYRRHSRPGEHQADQGPARHRLPRFLRRADGIRSVRAAHRTHPRPAAAFLRGAHRPHPTARHAGAPTRIRRGLPGRRHRLCGDESADGRPRRWRCRSAACPMRRRHWSSSGT